MCSTCRRSNSYTKHLWIHLGITAGNKNAMEMQVNYSSPNNQHKHKDLTLLQPFLWFRTKIRTKRCQIRHLACLSPTLTWLRWLVQRRERSGLAAPVPSILLDLCSHYWKCPADCGIRMTELQAGHLSPKRLNILAYSMCHSCGKALLTLFQI